MIPWHRDAFGWVRSIQSQESNGDVELGIESHRSGIAGEDQLIELFVVQFLSECGEDRVHESEMATSSIANVGPADHTFAEPVADAEPEPIGADMDITKMGESNWPQGKLSLSETKAVLVQYERWEFRQPIP